MKVTIAAIGKIKPSPERELYEGYVKRIPWKIACKEFSASSKAREAEQLLAACAGHERVIALDESGKTLSSREFAEQLKSWQQQGISSFAFVIGGADGLDESVLKKAALVWSFGRVTWPHMMVRGMLAEQLYRAVTLIAGHPYHRD